MASLLKPKMAEINTLAHPMNTAGLSRDYSKSALTRQQLAADPFQQFAAWFKQAHEAQILDANAMSLATVSRQGEPSVRTVLLKTFDENGFVFFTNYHSKKARHIGGNPNVAALFLWSALERQVTITGTATKISTVESLKYFATRSRGSQLGAWISQQSSVIASRKYLESKLQEIKEKFANGEVPLPSFWGGYRIVPKTFEFWQGRPNRLNDRFLYSLNEDRSWSIQRLAP